MENVKKLLSWLTGKPLATKILVTIAAILVAIALVFTSCGVAKSSVSGNRVVDKNVKDSLHYNVVIEK